MPVHQVSRALRSSPCLRPCSPICLLVTVSGSHEDPTANVSKAALPHIPVPLCSLDGEITFISVLVLLHVVVIWKKKCRSNLGRKGLNSAHNSRLQSTVAGRSRCKNLRWLVTSTAKSRTRVKRMHALLSLLSVRIQFRTSCLGNVATHFIRQVFLHQLM